MKKLLSMITLAGFLAGLGSSPLLYAQERTHTPMTKSKVKAAGQKGVERGKVAWESLSEEEQQQVLDEGKTKWQSLSSEERQELKRKANSAKRKYEALPE